MPQGKAARGQRALLPLLSSKLPSESGVHRAQNRARRPQGPVEPRTPASGDAALCPSPRGPRAPTAHCWGLRLRGGQGGAWPVSPFVSWALISVPAGAYGLTRLTTHPPRPHPAPCSSLPALSTTPTTPFLPDLTAGPPPPACAREVLAHGRTEWHTPGPPCTHNSLGLRLPSEQKPALRGARGHIDTRSLWPHGHPLGRS